MIPVEKEASKQADVQMLPEAQEPQVSIIEYSYTLQLLWADFLRRTSQRILCFGHPRAPLSLTPGNGC
jgi:hypothetical protein